MGFKCVSGSVFKWLLLLQRFDGSTVTLSSVMRRHLPGGQRWVARVRAGAGVSP